MEPAGGQGLVLSLGVLLVLALSGLGRVVALARNTRVLAHMRVDR